MKDGSRLAREGIMQLSPYVAGKPMEEVEAEYGVKVLAKLASNENPLGVSPKAVEAMTKEMKNCFMYPEGSSPRVRRKLALRLGVPEGQIFLATGGDHILTLLGNAFISQGEEVIMGAPSFYTYTLSTLTMGGVLVKVPLKNHVYDLDAILDAITPKTKLIFFCNPNNPTGTIVHKTKVAEFMSKVPDHCVVVFDEAYFEFINDPAYGNGVEDYVKKGANVVVLRTFSKLYGLAGLRIGYAVAAEHLAPVLGRVMPPFPVNRLAQVAAEAALDDTDFVDAVVKNNNEGRAYLNAEFDKLSMRYAPSYGNFIFVDIGMPAPVANEELLKRGIVIRPGQQWGCETYVRVSIGTPAENEAFIEALKAVKAEYSG
ncbi:MAG: histidinol-phosphate transaminase [Clostridiales bacterium]|nr:histidinol-phosphate transaminase [Clostridiales bacterium]